MDNDPEFIAIQFQLLGKMSDIVFKYIQPRKPTQNALIERLNSIYRENVLEVYQFDNLDEVRALTTEFIYDYNKKRPLDSLKLLIQNELNMVKI